MTQARIAIHLRGLWGRLVRPAMVLVLVGLGVLVLMVLRVADRPDGWPSALLQHARTTGFRWHVWAYLVGILVPMVAMLIPVALDEDLLSDRRTLFAAYPDTSTARMSARFLLTGIPATVMLVALGTPSWILGWGSPPWTVLALVLPAALFLGGLTAFVAEWAHHPAAGLVAGMWWALGALAVMEYGPFPPPPLIVLFAPVAYPSATPVWLNAGVALAAALLLWWGAERIMARARTSGSRALAPGARGPGGSQTAVRVGLRRLDRRLLIVPGAVLILLWAFSGPGWTVQEPVALVARAAWGLVPAHKESWLVGVLIPFAALAVPAWSHQDLLRHRRAIWAAYPDSQGQRMAAMALVTVGLETAILAAADLALAPSGWLAPPLSALAMTLPSAAALTGLAVLVAEMGRHPVAGLAAALAWGTAALILQNPSLGGLAHPTPFLALFPGVAYPPGPAVWSDCAWTAAGAVVMWVLAGCVASQNRKRGQDA